MAVVCGCSGNGPPSSDSGPTPPTNTIDPAPACAAASPGRAPLRRLSHTEYRHTLDDLFGNPALTAEATAGFLAETESLGFRNNADFLHVLTPVAQRYMDAAETIADRVAVGLTGCTDAACLQDWMRSFGRRVYRRPLTRDEGLAYDRLITAGITEDGPAEAVRWVVFTMLQSPNFLYRVELGIPGAPGYTKVRGYAMASRLSYLLWQSMPDEPLLNAAASGRLQSSEDVLAQAERMLDHPRARRFYRFFEEWLDLNDLPFIERDAAFGPLGTLREDLAGETKAFINHIVWQTENASLNELLTAPYTFVNASLASHYGLSDPGGAGFERVSVDPSRRAGFLTQGAVLAVHDRPRRTSIVNRGLKIRTALLCQTVGAPPDDVQLSFPETTADLSQRERLAQHRVDPRCAGCHNLIDPMGLPFENFDALGRWRTVDDGGRAIDPSTEMTATDFDGPVANAADLAQRLAESELVRRCFTTQLFRFAYGRRETADDACSQRQLDQAFAASGYSVRALLLALTQTDAFLYRPVAE